MLIPYGASAVAADTDISLVRHARVDVSSREPLRLNSGALGIRDQILDSLSSADAQFETVQEHLASLCDPWSRSAAAFLVGYFAIIEDAVRRDEREISERLKPYHGIYENGDYRFSAWLPLPLAHIASNDRPSGFVRFDFVFWTGAQLLAIDLQAASRSASRNRDIDKLRSSGVAIVDLSPSSLNSGAIADVLPLEARRFWESQPFPSGPIGQPALP